MESPERSEQRQLQNRRRVALKQLRAANPDLAHLSWKEITEELNKRYSLQRQAHYAAHPEPSPAQLAASEAMRLLIGGPLKLQRDNFHLGSVSPEHDYLGLWSKPSLEDASGSTSPTSSSPPPETPSRTRTHLRLRLWKWVMEWSGRWTVTLRRGARE